MKRAPIKGGKGTKKRLYIHNQYCLAGRQKDG